MPLQQDTKQLLRTGLYIFGTGVLSALLMRFAFGGVGKQGPHTNAGWLTLMVAMGCLPTGVLTLVLAFAKLLGEFRRR